LKQEGHLDDEDFYPTESVSQIDTIISQLHESLRQEGKDVLETYKGLSWDEKGQITVDNESSIGSNLVELLKDFILDNPKTRQKPGWELLVLGCIRTD
jgi:hypothetical protein